MRDAITVNIGEQVYNYVKEMIIDRKFPNDKRIDVVELKKMLKVSDTPVRQALNRLSYEGLLTNIPRKGYYPIFLTVEDIVEVYELRKMLELYSVEKAIKNINWRKVEQIKKTIESWYKQSNQNIKDKKFYDISTEIHKEIIIQSSAQRRVIKFYQEIAGIILLCQHFSEATEKATDEHLEILKYLQEGDVEKTKDLLARHIDRSKNKVIENYNKQGM